VDDAVVDDAVVDDAVVDDAVADDAVAEDDEVPAYVYTAIPAAARRMPTAKALRYVVVE